MRRINTRRPRERPALPPANLQRVQTPQLLDWDHYRRCCFVTGFTEEIDQRIGLVEEYLWGLLHVLVERNKSRDEVLRASIALVMADEAEERRFIEEDADLLPYHLFNMHTRRAIAQSVAAMEEEAREGIMQSFEAESLALVVAEEKICRMNIATEFFDSVFLKLCQTQPQWMWRRIDEIQFRVDTTALDAIQQEEQAHRQQLEGDYVNCMSIAYEMLAYAEKSHLLSCYQLPDGVTSAALLEESAIKIQAAYRGRRARRRVLLT